MTIRKVTLSAAALCALALARPAHAHFLWGEVSEGAAPTAKLSFAEGPGEISSGDLVTRIANASAWSADGKALTLQTGGAVRSAALEGTRAFGSSQDYGVLDKTAENRGVFKLMYFAKSAATLGDADHDVKLPFEFFARQSSAGEVVATLKRGGVAVANSTINVYQPGEQQPQTMTSDAHGDIRFAAAAPGIYGLRAAAVDETAGEQDGKKYAMTRNYTTLTFHVTPLALQQVAQNGAAANGAPVIGQTPKMLPVGPNPNADKKAYAVLKAAHDSRQMLPENFGGFTAKIVYAKDGAVSNGTLTYRRTGKTDISLPALNKDESSWVEDKLLNVLGHRRGGTFAEGDGRNPLTLGALPANYFGTLIKLNDGMHSEYRVKNNKVMEVTREAGGLRFTVSVIETMEAEPGKYLANHFLVSYRDAKTGELEMSEGYRDDYSKINGVWLPTMRVVVTTKSIAPGLSDSLTMQSIRLTDIKVMGAAPRVAKIWSRKPRAETANSFRPICAPPREYSRGGAVILVARITAKRVVAPRILA